MSVEVTETGLNLIPAGYKQTEVGVIPEDWEVLPIGSLCTIFGRIGFRGYTKADIVNEDQGVLSISPSNISQGSVDFDNGTYISWAKYYESPEIKIFNEDVLLVKTGSTYGKVGLVRSLEREATLNPQVVVLKNIKCPSSLLAYVMQSEHVQNQIEETIVGGAIPTLSQKAVANYLIPIPKKKEEQAAIADALSDVDALICELENLTAKKQAIKTATMQQLLTGRTRLPQFALREDDSKKGTKQSELGEIPEDWEVKTYGEVFTFLSTSTNSRSDLSEEGDLGYIHYGDIHTKWNNKLDLNKENLPRISKVNASSALVIDGDLIIADASEDYEGIGKSVEVFNVGHKQLIAGLHTFLLRDKDKVLADGFRGYLHTIPTVKNTFDRLATGMKVYGISKNNLSTVCIPVPSLEEQTAIASILSDMDEEIQSLKQRLSKTRQIKQGMMQELLTGKTRLVHGENG
ncbi:restriction endonuclease subunit S [Providencia rettgeri]